MYAVEKSLLSFLAFSFLPTTAEISISSAVYTATGIADAVIATTVDTTV